VPEQRFSTVGPNAVTGRPGTRILITRPEPGAARTLEALLTRGLDARTICLTEIAPLPYFVPSLEFDALIISSQNAVIHGAALLKQHRLKPVFVVGRRTADILRINGHRHVVWAENAAALLGLLIGAAPRNSLYLCGQTRRPELESGLKAANVSVLAVQIYAALPVKSAAADLRLYFTENAKTPQKTIVMFHAPSAVRAFFLAIKDFSIGNAVQFLCMSEAIAVEIRPSLQRAVSIAAYADEASMLNEIDKMLA
jgi:uroporphyrinogen-III synthase